MFCISFSARHHSPLIVALDCVPACLIDGGGARTEEVRVGPTQIEGHTKLLRCKPNFLSLISALRLNKRALLVVVVGRSPPPPPFRLVTVYRKAHTHELEQHTKTRADFYIASDRKPTEVP